MQWTGLLFVRYLLLVSIRISPSSYTAQPGTVNSECNHGPMTTKHRAIAPDMPDIGAGNKPVVVGDWSRYCIFDKAAPAGVNAFTGGGLSILRDMFSQASSGITRFHARTRVGALCTMAEAFRVMTIST
jgi:predicted phage gp36 major capsid-like protein